MDLQQTLLASLHADPADGTAWLALADCLEEEGEASRAELLRAQLVLNRAPGGRGREGGKERSACERRVQELLAAGVRPCVPTLSFDLARGVRLEAALVPAGTFLMGARAREHGVFTDERPRHRVTITRPFYLGIHPVTQEQWWAVMRRRPSRFRGPGCPVEQVSVDDAEGYCRLLGERINRAVRLPSEAEWEYACRAGTSTQYASGDGEEAMRRAGWCGLEETQPVGRKQPNGWGLFDMHGNVWEWCADRYADYQAADAVDPVVVTGDELTRVARGGSYSNPAFVCRSACRIGFSGGGRNDFIGCRVVVEWGPP